MQPFRALDKALNDSPPAALFHRTVALPKLLRIAHLPLKGPILNVGCGQGVITEGLVRKFPGVPVSAVDPDPARVARVKARLGDRARVSEGHPAALQFADGFFGTVVEVNALHHVPDYPQALREIHRVLKVGGQFLFMDITEAAFRGLRGKLFPPGHGFSKTWFRTELEEAGFTVDLIAGNWVILGRAVKTRNRVPQEGIPEEILDLMGSPRGGY